MSSKVINSSIENIYSLTPLQEGMLFHCLDDESSLEYIVQNEFKFSGHLDADKMKFALELLAIKHSALRTSIVYEKLSKPRQVVLKDRRIEFDEIDLTSLDENEREKEYIKFKSNDVKRKFDLQKDSLLRVTLVHLTANDNMMIFTYHHIIMDGWSLSILYGDFLSYYKQLLEGSTREELKKKMEYEKGLIPEYSKYVQYLERKDNSTDLDYWNNLLEGYEEEACIVSNSKNKHVEKELEKKQVTISKELTKQLKDFTLQCNITLSSVIETAWAITLAQYSYSKDVVFGKIISGRNIDNIPNIQKVLGVFINTVPVRVQFDDKTRIKDLLENVKKQDLDCVSHSHSPLVDIQNKTEQKGRLIQTLFVYENYYVDSNFLQLSKNDYVNFEYVGGREQTNYPITVAVKMDEESENLIISILYNSNEYEENEISRIIQRIERVLSYFVNHIDNKVCEISLLLEEDSRLIHSVNDTKTEYPQMDSVVDLFEEQVRKHPSNIATVFQGESLTYKELNDRANQIAHYLISLGIQKGDVVGILAQRHIQLIPGLLGIIKTGAVYLPLDLKNPKERTHILLNESNCKVVLCCQNEVQYENVLSINLENLDVTDLPIDNPLKKNKPENIIYIMYTSGTTGVPKGVAVTHKNVVRLVKNTNYVDLSNPRILQTGSLAFDASTFEIWGALLNGGMVCMADSDALASPEKLEHLIINNNINILFLTTALFNQIVDANPSTFRGLKELLVGGEKISEYHVRKLLDFNHDIKFSNIYGPTESTTYALFCPVENEILDNIPLGKPISNTTAYVINNGNLCGIGIPGELCLGGDGIALGYINSKELSEKKFIKNPYEPGKLLYRTGDLVCLLPDGNIDFRGRIDQQVKIRGFRIELDEIQKAIVNLPNVSESYVVIKEKNDNKCICAYVVADKELDAENIKNGLLMKLPEYMIPTYVVFLDKLPLNKNGKVNKHALPEPEILLENSYVEPTSDKEKALAKVFEETLGIEHVGITDSFYDLGGDSIKAIRIVSKYRAAGYIITVRDIMDKYTVQRIAAIASNEKETNLYKQEKISGTVVNTPIIRDFMKWNLSNPNGLIQSIMMETECLETMKIEQAFNILTNHHDILRAHYKNCQLKIEDQPQSKQFDLKVYDISNKLVFDKKMEQECSEIAKSIDLEKGPLVKVAYFKGKEKAFLFICIHHLVIDGVSWRILIEDIENIFHNMNNNKKILLPPKTASFIEWSEKLDEYSKTNEVMKQKDYWMNVSKQISNGLICKKEMVKQEYSSTFNITLKNDKTLDLLRNARQAFNTEINDILLSAIGLTIKDLTGQEKVAIKMEGHGRENIGSNIDISRTVGWFTTTYPVILTCYDNIERSVIETKEMLRNIPNHGIGYGLLKLGDNLKEPDISFNYLGVLDDDNSEQKKDLHFCTIGTDENDGNDVFSGISMNGFISNKCLSFTISYKGTRFSEEFVKEFALLYEKMLVETIDYCCSKKEVCKTPSDYSADKLSIKELDQINCTYGKENIEDIYSLTPLQEGMLYFKLNDNNSTGYVVQQILHVKNKIQHEFVEKALMLLAFRYEILRSIIAYENIEKPVIVTLKNRNIEYEMIDLSNLEKADSSIQFSKIQSDDVNRGFDLQKDSLLRVKLIYLPDNEVKMIWCFHHIIMDGWCMSHLYKEFTEYYKRLVEQESFNDIYQDILIKRRSIADYGDYLRWINSQDFEEGLNYWENLLSDYSGIADISPTMKPKKHEEQVQRQNFVMSKELSEFIAKQASLYKTTINTVLETALGILLMKYNYEEDVVFGKVVSGRDVDLPGIEEMVGLFINTIPIRIKAKKDMTFEEAIDFVRQQGNESRRFSNCPLSEIQKRTNQKRELFHILFVYENYYVDEMVGKCENGEFCFEVEAAREQTDYPLTIAAYMDESSKQLNFIFMYDPNYYVEEDISLIYKHYSRLLEEISVDTNKLIGNIDMIQESERNQIMNQFNNTTIEYPKNKTVIELMEEQVRYHNDDIAAVTAERQITYGELNKKSNQLAKVLKDNGVESGNYVAIMAEKSIEMLIGMCAILKVGAAYIPMDLKNPKERIDQILEDSNPKLILKYKSEISTSYPTIDLGDESNWKEELIESGSYSAESLAYIMYTSGTMGKPKGSMITNRGIVRLVKNSNYFQFNSDVTILQTGSIAFDASTFEIWGALLNGGKVILAEEECVFNPELLKKVIEEQGVNTMWLTAALFNQMVQIDDTIFDPLVTLLIGGEKLSEKHIQMLRNRNKNITIINGYGPTENTTFTTTYNIPLDFDQILIGKPIAQTKVYILNGMNLCGIGVPGELCITGDGLSKGYLNQEDLTREKFINNPFGNGKMYRSGDLACWMPDGNIKFFGRIDEQVKIRGYRIELQEINNVILAQNGITDAVTILKEDERGFKSIYTYFVADYKVNISELRDVLMDILPEYMIPFIMQITKIPLTRNGKVDKQKLPEIKMNEGTNYVAPKDEKEKAVCDAFSTILGIKQVGRTDNFFQLGGDSIKAIRIVSILRQHNYEISVKMIMNKHIVHNIASAMIEKQTDNKKKYEQNEVVGEIYDTPIICEFKEMNLQVPEHYNQDIMIPIDTDDESIIKNVLDEICKHHDILRSVFKNGHLRILPARINRGYEFSSYKLPYNKEHELKRICQSINESINLEKGPLFKAVLVKENQENYLYLCAHHLIVDAVSWRIISEDIQNSIKQILSGKRIHLPDKTASFMQWSKYLQTYKNKANESELQYWKDVVDKISENYFDIDKNTSNVVSKKVDFKLSKQETNSLLKDAGVAFNTEMNDLLISALAIGFNKLTKKSSFSIMMEGHGREELSKEIELDRTVGWFTSMYPVVFENLGDDYRNTIISTKETLRHIPNHGIGYGIWKDNLPIKRPEILFNYLGEIESNINSDFNTFGIGGSSSELNQRLSNISINGSIVENQLSFEISYNASNYPNELMQEFAKQFKISLIEVINYCVNVEKPEKTLSDYFVEDLDLQDFKTICNYLKNQSEISNIYSLTPLQEDMLLQSVINKNSTCYVVQEVFKTKSKFNKSYLLMALKLLSARYDVLRTVFIYENLIKPRQVVLITRDLEYEQVDLSAYSKDEAEVQLQHIIKQDVERGFDLQKDSLLRVKYIIMPMNENRMIWTYHHIILDGWCISMLFKEFFEYYGSLEEKESIEKIGIQIADKRRDLLDYSDYLQWIQKKDKDSAMEYWNGLLQDYNNIADIKPSTQLDKTNDQVKKYTFAISQNISKKIVKFAAQNNLTISTIFKSVWGVILQQYNLVDDVVFGEVVSGRNIDNLNVDNVIGLCINTIPVRVKSSKNMTIMELLSDIKQQSITSQSNSFCSLAEIQDLVMQKNNLIRNLCVYENFYIDEQAYDDMESRYSLELESTREQTDYPLNVVGFYDNELESLKIVIMYNPSIYSENRIINLVKHIEIVMEYFITHTNSAISTIPLILEEEKDIILNSFNRTDSNYDMNKTMIDLFEEQVELYPNNKALSMHDEWLSYNMLNEKANQVAYEIRKRNIKENDIIVVMINRSFEMIISILGILKAGAVFVPVDITYPKERIDYILKDCNPKAIIVSQHDDLDTDKQVINLMDSDVWNNPKNHIERANKPSDLAYIIYTSGTTGKPKGVKLRNQGVVNMRMYLKKEYNVDSSDHVLQFANYIFDAFIWELTISLLSGAELVLIDKDTICDIEQFNNYVKKKNITITLLPPQYYLQTDIKDLKVLTTGGSASNPEVVKKALNNKKYINAYGPTENTVLATHWIYNNDMEIPDIIPIGKPMDNVKAYIIQDGRLCGFEIPGELCIAGDGLADGYINKDDLTEKSFVENSFGEGNLYHTGDLARWLPDGNIEYIGRIDDQVKIRGFRIEKGEIETAFRKIKEIKDVAILDMEDQSGEKNLFAYIVANEKLDISVIRQNITKSLPSYMVPAYIMQIESIPLTRSGKIDKISLYSINYEESKTEIDDSRTEYERVLKEIWKDILNISNISIFDNFYYIGGNSLKISNMFTRINRVYPNCLTIGDIFANPTIATLAEQIEKSRVETIQLNQMKFPMEYFNHSKSNESISINNKEVLESVINKINELFNKDEHELFSMLMFAYSYLLNKTVKSSDIQICGFYYEEFFNISGHFKEIDNLNELKEILDKSFIQGKKYTAFKTRLHLEEKGLLPVLLFNTTETKIYKEFSDFAIVVQANKYTTSIKLQIINKNLNENTINQFLNLLITILQKII